MKRSTISLSALLGAVACAALPAMAATPDLGVTVHVTQPGVYGRIDLGRVPPPVVVYPQPIVVQPLPRVVTAPQPVYMWVPPGHQKHWSKHCGRYNACGVPVYFVQDGWYREHVMAGRGAVPPSPDGRPGYGGGPVYAPNPGYVYADGPGRGDDRDRGHGQKWKDKDRDDDRGRGHGHKGKGKDD